MNPNAEQNARLQEFYSEPIMMHDHYRDSNGTLITDQKTQSVFDWMYEFCRYYVSTVKDGGGFESAMKFLAKKALRIARRLGLRLRAEPFPKGVGIAIKISDQQTRTKLDCFIGGEIDFSMAALS